MAEHLYRKRISPATSSNVDELISKNVLAQLRRDPPPRPPAQGYTDYGKPGTGGSTGTAAAVGGHGGGGGTGMTKSGSVEASDLISTMAKRLGALEREMKERQSLLQQVQADNVMLKNKLKVAEEEIAKRALAAIEPRDDSAAVMHLRSENARLRAQLKYAWKQVEEMKAFLNDYGMVWMGEPEMEAELEANSLGIANAGGSAGVGAGTQGSLQLLSVESSDPWVPRRTSHSGAAPGPSSAAAAAATAAIGLTGESSNGSFRAGSAATPAVAAKRSTSFSSAMAASSSPTSTAVSRPPSSLKSPRSVPALSPQVNRGPPVDLMELQAKVEELNDLAGDGCGKIVRDAAGQHILAMQDPVNLVVYCDGVQIHTLPAKPFSDPASAAVLRDILDGYFPYVLKRDFPDGVPLRVVDRSSESYTNAPSKRGGGPSSGSVAISGRGCNIHTFDDIDMQSAGPEPVSRDRFLSRLPQAIIKNGKVIEIRSDISKMLGAGGGSGDGGKSDVALISTPVDALLSTMQRNHLGPSLPPPSRDGQPTEVTTLQVKSVDGKQTYILKFKYDDTIGTLRSCLDAHHAKAAHSGLSYEIRSAFPARAYTDKAETLRQAGLIPNATLFLRAV